MNLHKILVNQKQRFFIMKALNCLWAAAPVLLIFVIMLTVVNSFAVAINASLLYTILDSMTLFIEDGTGFQSVIWAAAVMACLMILFPFLSSLERLLKTRITQKLELQVKSELKIKMSKIAFEYLEDHGTYDLTSRVMSDTEGKITKTVFHALSLLSACISVCSLAVIIIRIAWWMLPISVIGAVPMLFVKYKESEELNQAEKEMTHFNRITSYISNLLLNKDNMKEIKLFQTHGFFVKRWDENTAKGFERTLKVQLKYGKRGVLINVLYAWLGTPVTFINIIFVIRGMLSLADYLVLLNVVGTFGLSVVHEIPNAFGELRKMKLFWNDITDFWNFKDVSYLELPNSVLANRQIEIVFQDVHFCYPNSEKEILKGVSFRVQNGEKLAIVGENGAGKSTIIKLLLGLYKPCSGAVKVNGMDAYTIPTELRKQLFSCVFQDFTKYKLSIRENIAFEEKMNTSNYSRIKEAAAKVLINQMIEQLPMQYDTMLGNIYEEGTDLSEGQWQKLNIAKAYYSNAGIMILDEPTASLDPSAEADVYRSFQNLSRNKTCLLVSHRLGSARIGERILVIKNGLVAEEGSHKQLMKNKGIYSAMFEAQAEWYER